MMIELFERFDEWFTKLFWDNPYIAIPLLIVIAVPIAFIAGSVWFVEYAKEKWSMLRDR